MIGKAAENASAAPYETSGEGPASVAAVGGRQPEPAHRWRDKTTKRFVKCGSPNSEPA